MVAFLSGIYEFGQAAGEAPTRRDANLGQNEGLSFLQSATEDDIPRYGVGGIAMARRYWHECRCSIVVGVNLSSRSRPR